MLRGPWMLVLVVVAPVGALFEAGSVEADMMRWVRITTFNTPNLPNPAVQFVEPRGGPATISFRARAELIEEGRGSASEVPALGPTALVLLALALAAAATLRLRAA